MHVFFLLNFEDLLWKDVPAQDQLDGWEDIERIVFYQGLFYIPEIIRIELTSHYGIEKSSRACC